jgi:DNA (cytosine-5)-methyltransferase 1
MTDELKDLRYGSICSGIETATVAWHPLGWEPAWFSELDAFPSEVLKHHYPGVPNHGDFTQILRNPDHPARSVPLDLLVGGTPCQAFSVAGLRRGFDDDRGNLTLEFCRLVGLLRPRWVVWENVPGVLSIDGGRALGSILGAFRELGYGFAYRILDAQHFGVPQRRRRVFLVGHSGGDWRAPAAVLFEPEGVFGNPPKGSKTRKGASRGAATGAGADGGGVEQAFNSHQDTCAGTLRVGGNPPTLARHSIITQGDIAGPLDASYYKGQGSRQGGEREFVAIRRVAHGEYTDDGTASTLAVRDYKSAADLMVASAREGAMAAETKTYRKSRRAQSVDDHETWVEDETANTLNTFETGDVRTTQSVVVPTLTAASNPSRSPQSSEVTAQVADVFEAAYTVRRLTPVECERLQGFPDDYSQIPIKGKPAADGPRYKALGNSMAVPVMRWIGQRIAKVDALLKKSSEVLRCPIEQE